MQDVVHKNHIIKDTACTIFKTDTIVTSCYTLHREKCTSRYLEGVQFLALVGTDCLGGSVFAGVSFV